MLPVLISALATTVVYGARGVMIGSTVAIGYGMGRTYGTMACEYLDSLQIKAEESWKNRMPKDLE